MPFRKHIVLLFISVLFAFICGCAALPSSSEVSETSIDISGSDEDNTYTVFDDVTVSGNKSGISVSGNKLTIKKAGTYALSGKSENGSIIIDADSSDEVVLKLQNLELSCKDGAPLIVMQTDKAVIELADGSENFLSDGSSYSVKADGSDVDAAVFSKDDLYIRGNGTLTVSGNMSHGIVSKDDLTIESGSINVTAINTGIEGKDSINVENGDIAVSAGTNGLRSDNSEESGKGFITVSNGNISIKSDGKGLNAESMITINGGTVYIEAVDDAIHSNDHITVEGGVLSLSSEDDGIHADSAFTLNDGEITVTESYEGIEAGEIYINGGKADITASDDGINAGGGSDTAQNGEPPQDPFASDSSKLISITGGYILINAEGDGVDSNGSVDITGGITLVNGPSDNGNGALDYGTQASISGGYFIAAGSSGMAESFTSAEEQCALMINANGSADKITALCDESGNVIISFKPCKDYENIVLSAPKLQKGAVYTLYTDAQISESDENGFSENAVLTSGTPVWSEEITEELTGSTEAFGGRNGDHGHGRMPGDFGERNTPPGGFEGYMPPGGLNGRERF